jgi:hypothetical protein
MYRQLYNRESLVRHAEVDGGDTTEMWLAIERGLGRLHNQWSLRRARKRSLYKTASQSAFPHFKSVRHKRFHNKLPQDAFETMSENRLLLYSILRLGERGRWLLVLQLRKHTSVAG